MKTTGRSLVKMGTHKVEKLICLSAIAMMMVSTAGAALVYSTDSFGYTASGSGAFVLGGATPDVTATQWFGSTNGANAVGDLSFTNSTASRYRGLGVWLDASAWNAGTVTVGVDVTGYTAGGSDSIILFHTFAANGVDASNSVSLDLHGSAGLDGSPAVVAGTPTIAIFGTEQTISGAATQDFTFTYNGTDQFIGLVFAIENLGSATSFTSADLDNLTVNTFTTPEPSSLALLAMGGLLLARTRRKGKLVNS